MAYQQQVMETFRAYDMSASTNLKNLILLLTTTLVALLFVELALHLLGIPPRQLTQEMIRDDILVNRMPTDYPEIDGKGFRNGKSEVSGHVDIVTLGDSHTYGYNVPMSDNWPSQISRLTGQSVYNMGIGGYGILQYAYLVDRAMEFKPRHIMLGLYLANDLKDICYAYRMAPYWKENYSTEELNLAYCDAADVKDARTENAHSENSSPGIAEILKNSHLWALWDRAKPALERTLVKRSMNKYIVVDDDKNSTLISRYLVKEHGKYMDPEETEVSRSLEATKKIIRRMAEKSNRAGATLVIMFIPSKELAFHDYLRDRNINLPDYYEKAFENEIFLKSELSAFLNTLDIPTVDAAPAVISALNESGEIYTKDDDGHPVTAGYHAYATAMYQNYWTKFLAR
ncbi:MAG: hypothetical protein IPK65_07540 [Gammaproteobacteria bacterium]|nr:hypothetical protein [Gammaproteobacteria bacterium]